VGARLREQNCLCSTVALGIRDNRLLSSDRQTKLPWPTANTLDIWDAAVEVFKRHHASGVPVRSLSVKASGLVPAEEMEQMSLFPEEQKAQRRAMIDQTLDKLRRNTVISVSAEASRYWTHHWIWMPKGIISFILLVFWVHSDNK
jgi:DNA polymerase-4